MKKFIVLLATSVGIIQGADLENGASCIPGNKQGYSCKTDSCCGAISAQITTTATVAGKTVKGTLATAVSRYICQPKANTIYLEYIPKAFTND